MAVDPAEATDDGQRTTDEFVSGLTSVAGDDAKAIEEPGVSYDAIAVDPAEATDDGQRTTAGVEFEAIEQPNGTNATEGARESFEAGCARIRRRREEDVRKLNEQARWQAEQAMAARRAYRRKQKTDGSKPGDQPVEQKTHGGPLRPGENAARTERDSGKLTNANPEPITRAGPASNS
jgi:hypothetical protein